MLSYRHAFHAGNFADVMKHVVLMSILRYQVQKDAALCYIDTHAGAGCYELDDPFAQKTREFAAGIARIWQRDDVPAPVGEYLTLVREHNGAGELQRYPGSPWLAARILRPTDRLALCELHGTDLPLLEAAFAHDRRVRCYREDGYRFAAMLLPPPERRGLVFMDPSFELRGEYETAITAITQLHRRFATGTYALWYPILTGSHITRVRKGFVESGMRDVLHLALKTSGGQAAEGMYGCGVVVINPPWTLRESMSQALPYLAEQLATGPRAGCQIDQWVEE